MTAEDTADPVIHENIILGKYYAWRGGSGVRDDYSRTIVRFKKGETSAVEFFTGKVARRIKGDDSLNRPACILVPIPSSKAHDAQRPHRGELLCQAVAAVPGIKVTYGNYVIRHTTINSSHGRFVASRPSVEEHLKTLEIRIPALSGKYVSKLGPTQWRTLDAILFDDVRYFGATSEACAIKLLQAGFRRVYAVYLGQNQP
jgi:predicted amidophosphoribosyltransferase